jgi:ArsR family transcriptional regulator, arsenate/arsenite/antimonite-responsive transcriptional repressor
MREILSITKALADPGRLRILCALRHGELCACHISELLSLAPSTVSRHTALLVQSGLVRFRKDGRWMHYRLASGSGISPVAQAALNWVLEFGQKTGQSGEDDRQLGEMSCAPAGAATPPPPLPSQLSDPNTNQADSSSPAGTPGASGGSFKGVRELSGAA